MRDLDFVDDIVLLDSIWTGLKVLTLRTQKEVAKVGFVTYSQKLKIMRVENGMKLTGP